jgi:hypothetical protein
VGWRGARLSFDRRSTGRRGEREVERGKPRPAGAVPLTSHVGPAGQGRVPLAGCRAPRGAVVSDVDRSCADPASRERWRPDQPRSSRGEAPTKGRPVCLPARRPRQPLAPELEAIAAAAADRVRAQADATADDGELQRRVAEAASAAIAAAEQIGQARARGELGPDALKRIARASRRRREADAEYEQEILRGDRLGLTGPRDRRRRRGRTRNRPRHPRPHRSLGEPATARTRARVGQRRRA